MLIDSSPGTLTNYQPFDAPEPFADRIDIGSLNVQYHFDFADLTSTTSYWNRDEQLRQDGAEEIATCSSRPSATSRCIPPTAAFGPNSPTSARGRQVEAEERGDPPDLDRRLQFQVAGRLFLSGLRVRLGPVRAARPEAVPVFGTGDGFTQYQPTKILQNSFFGEASYTLPGSSRPPPGLRRYYYHGTVNTAVSGWLSSSGNSSYDYFSTGEKDSGVTPKLNLSYQVDKDLMVYGTASQGFRPGGGNQPIPATGALGSGPTGCLANLEAIGLSAAPPGFKPDKVWSYELGEKFRDSDGPRHRQLAPPTSRTGSTSSRTSRSRCGFPFTGNAGDAHIYGAELEIDACWSPGLLCLREQRLDSHARVHRGAVPGTTIDDRVQNVPDWTARPRSPTGTL